jgi:hypothetical protein
VTNVWVAACKGKVPVFNGGGYGDRSWIPDAGNTANGPVWNGVIHPSNTYGSKLKRQTDGKPMRKQEMPLNVVCHAICLFTDRGAKLVDPFAGSGVVGMAGIRLGRPVLSIELFPDTKVPGQMRHNYYWAWCRAYLGDRALFDWPTEVEQSKPYAWWVA